MQLFIESELRQKGRLESSKLAKGAREILLLETRQFNKSRDYDIFLSHSFKDAELILGLRTALNDLGYEVYVDWVDDPELDRSNVDEKTAEKLKFRMSAARSLFYVTTENAKLSKWMPWECGYFDALKEKVAIFPIVKGQATAYEGQEYLGLYPYCLKGKSLLGKDVLRIKKPNKGYTVFDHWVNTPNDKVEWKDEK